MSVEEKIRRAEEIYEKRKQGMERPVTTVNLNNIKKNDCTDHNMFMYLFCNILST